MTNCYTLSRRSFLALAAASAAAFAMPKGKHIPVGLELYSVRDELAKDLMGTVRAVAKIGYEVVEFFSPYYEWTPDYAKEVRKLLDDLGVRCLSTHNPANAFTSDGIQKAIDLNQILGVKYIVMSSPGDVSGLDGWKTVAERLNQASERLKPLGMRAGYHNHNSEFRAVEGKRPIEILAANTSKDVALQLDTGNCMDGGGDPLALIKANPGRITSMHLKDWAAGKGASVLLGEGEIPWAKIFEAAESKGGIEYYLIEQEGSRYSPMETAERCLAAFKKLKAR